MLPFCHYGLQYTIEILNAQGAQRYAISHGPQYQRRSLKQGHTLG